MTIFKNFMKNPAMQQMQKVLMKKLKLKKLLLCLDSTDGVGLLLLASHQTSIQQVGKNRILQLARKFLIGLVVIQMGCKL